MQKQNTIDSNFTGIEQEKRIVSNIELLWLRHAFETVRTANKFSRALAKSRWKFPFRKNYRCVKPVVVSRWVTVSPQPCSTCRWGDTRIPPRTLLNKYLTVHARNLRTFDSSRDTRFVNCSNRLYRFSGETVRSKGKNTRGRWGVYNGLRSIRIRDFSLLQNLWKDQILFWEL